MDSKEENLVQVSLETQALLLRCQAEVAESKSYITKCEDYLLHSDFNTLKSAYENLDKYTRLFNTIKDFQTAKHNLKQKE